MSASAIVCQIQKITEHALKHDADRLAIRAALRDALVAVLPEQSSGRPRTASDLRLIEDDFEVARQGSTSVYEGGDAA